MNERDEVFHEVVIVHARFLIDEAHREQTRREVAAQDRGALTMVDVEHEADLYCCAIEPPRRSRTCSHLITLMAERRSPTHE
jgi:hypothetical protein